MALYAKTLTTTFANLATTLSSMTANTSITISDPANVTLGSPDTSGTIGYIIKNYTGSYLVDLSPTDMSSINVGGVTSYNWFQGCTKLSGIGKLPNISTGQQRFYDCTNLVYVNTSNYTQMTNGYYMFYGCTSLTSFDLGNFLQLTSSKGMFMGCTSLASVTNFNSLTSLATTDNMFSNCTALTSFSITVSSSKIESAMYMFSNCTALTSFSMSNVDKLVYSDSMFYGCTSLTSFSFPSNVTTIKSMGSMFYGCSKLTTFDISIFTYASGIVMNHAFQNCTSLKTVYAYYNTTVSSTASSWSGAFSGDTALKSFNVTTLAAYNAMFNKTYSDYANIGLTSPITPTLAGQYVYKRIA